MSLYPGPPTPTSVRSLGSRLKGIEPPVAASKPSSIEELSPSHDQRRVDRYLKALFAQVGRRFGGNPHLKPLLGRLEEFVLRGGKRVRPRLCLASYKIMSGRFDAPPRGIWMAASCLELLHGFMLVHDDLIDGSVQRRQHATLHEQLRDDSQPSDGLIARKRGADLALIGGDLLFALALHMLSRSGLDELSQARAQRLVSEMLLETGIGEALDVLYDDRPLACLDESHVLEAYVLKTSRYSIAGPMVLGATLAGATPAVTGILDQFGDLLGLAYQIQNDLDGICGDVELDDFSDLDTGKRTYVLWVTHRRLNDAGRAALDDALAGPPGPDRRRRIVTMIRGSGAVEECRARIDRLHNEAIEVLGQAPLDASQRKAFVALLSMFGLKGKATSHVNRA